MGNVKAFLCLGVGYLLLFAAFEQGGKYARTPWQAMKA